MTIELERITKIIFIGLKVLKSKKKERQIIVCGFPRSGTSLLFNILCGIVPGFTPYTGPKTKNRISKESSYVKKIMKPGSYITKQPADIFKIKKLKKWNIRNKKIVVFVCIRDIRDLLVSKHQLLPNDYYMGYDWRLKVKNGNKINTGIKHFYEEIKKIRKYNIPNCDVHFIHYEQITEEPNIINEFLKKSDINTIRNAERFFEEKNLPYSKNDAISKGHENERIINNTAKWLKNEKDRIHVEKSFDNNPELYDILEYFNYKKSDSLL